MSKQIAFAPPQLNVAPQKAQRRGSVSVSNRLSRRSTDEERLLEAKQFISSTIPARAFESSQDVVEQLRDGVKLCHLFNALVPDAYKIKHISDKPLYFQSMDNLNSFISSCKRMGIEDRALFTPLDVVHKRPDSTFHLLSAILALKDWYTSGATIVSEPPVVSPRVTPRHAEAPTATNTSATNVTVSAATVHIPKIHIPGSSPKNGSPRSQTVTNPGIAPAPTMSPVISRMRQLGGPPSIQSGGSFSSVNDDDWETDPDWENTDAVPERAIVSPMLEDQDDTNIAFGTRRGKCFESNCSCEMFHGTAGPGAGGPCNNCGHYPAKHQDLGGDEFSTLQMEIPGFLIRNDLLRYEFVIGEGSFGTVYKGLLWGKEVAIKKLKYDARLQSRRRRQEFVKEIKMMASLRHPNVILWMGVCLDPPAIITELLERGSLGDLLHIRREEVSWSRRLKLGMDMCLGVNYLHNLGIVHQDLKSSNLLIDKHYNLKVGDFGLSHFVRNALPNDSSDSLLFDGAGGTAAYMAPELLRSGERIGTFKTDVYSVGVILWEIASQRKPFDGREDTVSMLYHVDQNLERPPLEALIDCPVGLSQLIQDCWASIPDERPGMEQVISRLKDIISAVGAE